tara:strand:- start:1956 stop:2090 length:135 start_codon:yes stop_codon:yes gene_type:complete
MAKAMIEMVIIWYNLELFLPLLLIRGLIFCLGAKPLLAPVVEAL